MKKIIYLLIPVGVLLLSCASKNNRRQNDIQIEWVQDLSDDFSFKEYWSYPEGIFLNEHGQLSCDGIRLPEVEKMIDEGGKIFIDSLDAFYSLVDTTHLYHSIITEAYLPEWNGTNFISATRTNKDTVKCFTLNNSGTHSSLNFIIADKKVKPFIILNSINSLYGEQIYDCSGGKMLIDVDLWDKGILKASFDFSFVDVENPDKRMYCKGKIYAEIKNSHCYYKNGL